MVQHLIIVYVTPPLMLWGLPWRLVDAVLARPWVKAVARRLLHPAVCCMAFAADVCRCGTCRKLHEAALRDRSIHILEHLDDIYHGGADVVDVHQPVACVIFWRAIIRCGWVCAFMLMIAHMPGFSACWHCPTIRLYRTYELCPAPLREL